MTDSTTTDDARNDTGDHAAHPVLADHEPDETLALGRRMTDAAAAETPPDADGTAAPLADASGQD
ncbi:MAG: hypothetical protein ABWX82_07460 [Leifsonia sp.]